MFAHWAAGRRKDHAGVAAPSICRLPHRGGPAERAQAAGAVRPDVTFSDVVRLVSGISMVRFAEPEQISRLLSVALDGLRYGAGPAR